MQLSWLWRGLRTGVVTTRYPDRHETMPAGWRGVAVLDGARCRPEATTPPCVAVCLSRALSMLDDEAGGHLALDEAACVACGLCVSVCPQHALSISPAFELAGRTRERLVQVGSGPQPVEG